MSTAKVTGRAVIDFIEGGSPQIYTAASNAEAVVMVGPLAEASWVPNLPNVIKVPLGNNETVISLVERIQGIALLLCLCLFCLLLPNHALAQTCVQPSSEPIAWWPLDETTGTIAADIVGNKPGAHFDGPTHVSGKVRGALQFDGVDDFVGVGDSDLWAFGNRDFTIELWAYFNSPGGGTIGHPSHIFIGNDEGPFTVNKWFFALGGGFLNFHINGPSIGSHFFPLAPFSPAINQWYHLAITRNGNTWTIYVNGVAVASAINTVAVPNANASLTIGQAESLGFVNGRLDEVTIYNRALTQAELQSVVDASTAGKCKPLPAVTEFVSPSRGGDTGTVTVRITGNGFMEGASAKLRRAGNLDIVGTQVALSEDGTTVTATFDLTGKARGLWAVVVTNPDGSTNTLPGAFTIEEGRNPQLWVDIIGRGAIRAGREQTLQLLYGNRGNNDITGGFLFIGLSGGLEYKLEGETSFRSLSSESILEYRVLSIPTQLIGTLPLTVRASATIAEVRISAAISDGNQRFRTEHSRVKHQLFGDLTSNKTPESGVRSAATASIQLAVDYSRPILPGGSEAATGYIDYFIIDQIPGITLDDFGEIGIRIDNDVVWSFPGVGVTRVPFSDIKDGSVTMNRRCPSTQPPGSCGTIDVSVKHVFSIRPDIEAKMPGIAEQISAELPKWFNADFCNPMPEDATSCASCVGLADVLLYASGTPFGQPHEELTTDDYVKYWLTVSRVDGRLLEAVIRQSLVNPRWFLWWFITKRDFQAALVLSFDPNDKFGSRGSDTPQFLSGDEPLRYSIFFENVETATAPAQEVVITDQLDTSKIDLNSISLGPISFGNKRIIPPPGLTEYTTTVDLRPERQLLVTVEGSINKTSGLLTWRFRSIDPGTGELPDDPLVGFLPPNRVPPEGDGSVLFTAMPKKELSTGTEIRNQARVFFDMNAPIDTAQWFNTIDNSKPMSNVLPLTASQCESYIQMQWAGTDEGSGIANYTIYVSDDGGPFTIWQQNTTATSGTYTGQLGHTYAFYSLAQDMTGNIEGASANPDATVTLSEPAPPRFTIVPSAITVHTSQGATACGVFVSDATLGAAAAQGACSDVNITRNGVPSGNIFPVGNTTITYTATDASDNTAIAMQIVTVTDDTPPTLIAPGNVSLRTGPGAMFCGAFVSDATLGNAIANDDCVGVTIMRSGVPSGNNFPVGTTTITYTATDASGNTSSATQTVAVTDNTPPTIIGESANPTVLWPPNHTMRDVTVSYNAKDNCSAVNCVITNITSNEPVNGTGDGDAAPDWEIVDAHHVRLRAERAATGSGRTYTLTITCTDLAGNQLSKTITVQVTHNITGPASGAAFKIGAPVTFVGAFWDLPGKTHTAQWTFDEMLSTTGKVLEPSGSKPGTVTGTYTFTTPGVYKIKMKLTDNTGQMSWVDSAGDLEAIVVIYDPNGSYTIGGGYVSALVGSYLADPSKTGKLSFGFNSKYTNATNPKGETQIQFAVGSLEFNALNYDYLAISGARAQFRGFGKVNGESGYNFILTVIDGQLTGGGGVDKFRIKIWNKTTGAIVFDTQMGASDAADPNTPVGTGSNIVIQK